jgi:hypothetical protein
MRKEKRMARNENDQWPRPGIAKLQISLDE